MFAKVFRDNSIECENIQKFQLCVLRTQFGKTFISIKVIKDEISNDIELGKGIHIIFTMNTLLNNKQFAKRLGEIEDVRKDSICVFSSKYSGSYIHVKNIHELKGRFSDDDETTYPSIILMCSNNKRFKDGIEFIEFIDKSKRNIHRIFVYFDELHEYIDNKKLRDRIESIDKLGKVKKILALTASPDKLWNNSESNSDYWSNIKLIKLSDLSHANYVGVNDIIFNCVDEFFSDQDSIGKNKQTVEYIEYILDKYPKILGEGSFSFIPGKKQRSSHNAIRDLVFKKNEKAVVFLINGVEKSCKFKDHSDKEITIPLISNNEELCETISRIVIKNNLQNRPKIITGLLCVSMGQTLTHKTIGSFTTAILSHLDLTNDEIYQLFGRVTGRLKDWDTYKQTQIYCPTIIMNRCKIMEECAKNMIEEYNGEVVSQEDYRKPITNSGENIMRDKKEIKEKRSNDDKDYKEFNTQEEAIKFGKENLNVKFNKRRESTVPQELIINGRKPSSEDLYKRFWGINKNTKARMCPTIDDKWCVWWRPSLITSI